MRKFLAVALTVVLPAALPVIGIQAAQAAKKGNVNLADGKKVYQANCATCHGALTAKKPALPDAADFFAGKLRLTHGNTAKMEQITKVGGAKFGHGASAQMPSWGAVLSPKQIADVVAFELTLHK